MCSNVSSKRVDDHMNKWADIFGAIFFLRGMLKAQMYSVSPCTQYDLKETIQYDMYS
jgi:hypothetical protein